MPPLFTIKRDVVTVESELFKHPWIIDVKYVDGMPFFEVGMTDRCLARAMGLNMYERSPFADTTLLQYMAKMRNDTVNQLILAHQGSTDPMADDAVGNAGGVRIRKRENAYSQASIPSVITVKFPAFVKDGGECIGGIDMRVVATRRTDVLVSVEVSSANLQWMSDAINVEWDISGSPWANKRKASVLELDLPELGCDNCRYLKKQRDTVVIACSYRTAGGIEKDFCKRLYKGFKTLSEVALNEHVMAIEAQVHEFVQKNNVESHDVAEEGPPAVHADIDWANSDDDGNG